MIISDAIFTPQQFIAIISGEVVFFQPDGNYDTIAMIEDILEQHTYGWLEKIPLNDIIGVLKSDLDVVLLDVSGHNEDGEWVNECCWWQVTDNFLKKKEGRIYY